MFSTKCLILSKVKISINFCFHTGRDAKEVHAELFQLFYDAIQVKFQVNYLIATIILSCFLQSLNVALNLLSPVLLKNIIDFLDRINTISTKERIYEGGIMLAALAIVRIAGALLSQSIDMRQVFCSGMNFLANCRKSNRNCTFLSYLFEMPENFECGQ